MTIWDKLEGSKKMPFKFEKITKEDVQALFKKAAASEQNVAPIIAALKDAEISVGDGFQIKIVYDGENEVDPESGLTIRQTKRRYNAAAEALGLEFKWRQLGHTEPTLLKNEEGKEYMGDYTFTDWLVVQVNATTPVVTNANGEVEKRQRGRPKKVATEA